MLDFNQHNCNENTVTTINDFNNRHVKMYADTISKVDRFFIASSQYLIADDMGGNTEHEISNPNKDIVNVSPYGLRGFLHDKFTYRILVSEDPSLQDIKEICNTYPDKYFHFLMGISTYPLNDKHAPIQSMVDKLLSLDCNNLYITFLNGWDMYIDLDFGFSRVKKFKLELNKWPQRKLQFLLANMNLSKLYKKNFPDADVQYYTIYPIRIADSVGKVTYPKYINEDKKTKNKLRTKKLICLNNHDKGHRTEIVELLEDYEEQVYYSYRAKGKTLPKEFVPKYTVGTQHNFSVNQDSPPYRLVKNNYCWVSCETFFNTDSVQNHHHYNNNSDLYVDAFGFLTEKTFKAFYFELPFIIVGLPNSYEVLKELGFETFPEFFDESFDTETDHRQRMKMIKNEIKKFLDTPLKEIDKLFWDKNIQRKIKHNKDLILHYAKNDPFNDLAYEALYGD